MAEKAEPPGVTSETLAHLFDCSTRQIELLARKNIAVRVGRGRYNATASTQNYIKHLREQAAARVGQDGVDGVAANAKYKDASTQLLQMRIRREAGELVAVSEVREGWARLMRGIRQLVLSLPGKIAFEVPTLSAHDRRIVERICRDGLEDASLDRGFDVRKSQVSEDATSDQEA